MVHSDLMLEDIYDTHTRKKSYNIMKKMEMLFAYTVAFLLS